MDSRAETESQVFLKADHLSTFSLAAQQNAYPLFRSLSLNYPGEVSDDRQTLSRLVVKLTSEPELFSPEEWPIDEIRPGQIISLQQRPLNKRVITIQFNENSDGFDNKLKFALDEG